MDRKCKKKNTFLQLNLEIFYLVKKLNTAFQHKNLIPVVIRGGGRIMVQTVFLLLDRYSLPSFDGAMNSE